MSDDRSKKMRDLFGNKRFDVESSLNLYAHSFVVLPAFAIYEEDLIRAYMTSIRNCHIYLIGLLPKIDVVEFKQEGSDLVVSYSVNGKQHDLRWPIPSGFSVEGDGESEPYHIVNADGTKLVLDQDKMLAQLGAEAAINFRTLYIGQAFGENGSRNALDRLRKHETLQKIAVKGIPEGEVLTLLLLEIIPTPRMVMMFNPFAKDKTQGQSRVDKVIDKLANTSEAEKTTIYEAALIRYFSPPFNKEFKDSFPSSNMKLLADCYTKDITAIMAEIVFDNLPFRLGSDMITYRDWHIAHHDLHKQADRKVFFLGSSLNQA